MSEKRNEKPTRPEVEIVPLCEHRRITLPCPNCEQSFSMDIRQKTRVRGKVTYYVTCPNCGHDFRQVGRPHNFWRDIKRRYGLSPAQLRAMQSEMIRKVLETGDIPVEETMDTIRTGDMVFIKPDRRDSSE